MSQASSPHDAPQKVPKWWKQQWSAAAGPPRSTMSRPRSAHLPEAVWPQRHPHHRHPHQRNKGWLPVLTKRKVLTPDSPPFRLGVVPTTIGDLCYLPCLVAVLPFLELGRGDAVPRPIFQQRSTGLHHGPVPSLQKPYVRREGSKMEENEIEYMEADSPGPLCPRPGASEEDRRAATRCPQGWPARPASEPRPSRERGQGSTFPRT